jgi:hypothetical protein
MNGMQLAEINQQIKQTRPRPGLSEPADLRNIKAEPS